MDFLRADDYWTARLVFQRALGVIYFVAFLVAVRQFVPLLGANGLLPVPDYLRAVPFRRSPSLFYWRYSDRVARLAAWTGLVLAAAVVVGLVDLAPLAVAMPYLPLLPPRDAADAEPALLVLPPPAEAAP